MGSLSLPASGTVYVDANCIIYSVEKVKPFEEVLRPLWQAAAAEQISVISSQISLLEVLVKPLRKRDEFLETAFRSFLPASDEFQLVPIDLPVIERAAGVRADASLKSPDAIHAATALEAGVRLFVTNDPGFRRVEGLAVAVLSEVLSET